MYLEPLVFMFGKCHMVQIASFLQFYGTCVAKHNTMPSVKFSVKVYSY